MDDMSKTYPSLFVINLVLDSTRCLFLDLRCPPLLFCLLRSSHQSLPFVLPRFQDCTLAPCFLFPSFCFVVPQLCFLSTVAPFTSLPSSILIVFTLDPAYFSLLLILWLPARCSLVLSTCGSPGCHNSRRHSLSMDSWCITVVLRYSQHESEAMQHDTGEAHGPLT
ncbi:hypothetical protein Q5P01_005358 [Channa striata]|uniref:Uncharacterized protein n=1 Tax=Channa striata TaxID=64152 RepID=A0AA88NHG9_CHASR|nr:hypothetical protein Q5P01_005358 [Channa striata]